MAVHETFWEILHFIPMVKSNITFRVEAIDTYFFGILIVVSLSGITKKFDEASPEKSEACCSKQKVTQRRGRDVTFGTSAWKQNV